MQSAILITYDKDDIKNEAVALCDSAGYQILHIIQQKFLQRQKYGISEEIVERLDSIAQKLNPDVIVFDEVLKPSQNYNLASKLRRNILDRETLILEIFERRASSSESHLQPAFFLKLCEAPFVFQPFLILILQSAFYV